jgi:hypothetical protein
MAALVSVSLNASPSLSAEVAGADLPESLIIGEKTCTLAGVGIRKKFVVKVYAAGLYMENPSTDPAEIIGSDQAKGMLMHFLYKKVEAEKLQEAWIDGFEGNTPQSSADLQGRMDEFVSLFAEDSLKGEEILMTYVPGTGTAVTIKGEDKGTIPGADFMEALFAVWFGEKPADKGLKKGILSGPP